MLLYHYTSAKALIGGKKVKPGQGLKVFPGGLRPSAKTHLKSTLSVDGMGWLTEQPDANVPYLPDPEEYCFRLTIEIPDESIVWLVSEGNLCRWPEVREHIGAPRLDAREDQWWLFRGTIPAAAFRALDELPGRPFWLNDDPDAIVARDVSDAAAPAIPCDVAVHIREPDALDAAIAGAWVSVPTLAGRRGRQTASAYPARPHSADRLDQVLAAAIVSLF